MKIEEHFMNKIAATKVIRDYCGKISILSADLKAAKDVKDFEDILLTLRGLCKSNMKEINKLL